MIFRRKTFDERIKLALAHLLEADDHDLVDLELQSFSVQFDSWNNAKTVDIRLVSPSSP